MTKTPPEITRSELIEITNIARLAPSVHNVQPWKIKATGNKLVISIDSGYRLTDGDPTGRQTVISLGIFTEAVIIAASQLKLVPTQIELKNDEAIVVLKRERVKSRAYEINALETRVTDRSVYKVALINKKNRDAIVNAVLDVRANVWIIENRSSIRKIADLTAKGIQLALSNPSFRKELSNFLLVPWSSRKRGISTSSLYIPRLLALCEPLLMRLGIGLRSEVRLERKRWESASAVILVTTPGDMPADWFEAGRAYIQVALKIEELGYSQATSAATVEASNYHEDVERIISTDGRLQCVLRIGRGAHRRKHSPRVSANELIT